MAQTVYVSNLGQTDAAGLASDTYMAISFTTGGGSTARFSLTSVVLDIDTLSTTVRVYSNSSGNPGTQVGGSLVKQGSDVTGEITFNAPSVRHHTEREHHLLRGGCQEHCSWPHTNGKR